MVTFCQLTKTMPLNPLDRRDGRRRHGSCRTLLRQARRPRARRARARSLRPVIADCGALEEVLLHTYPSPKSSIGDPKICPFPPSTGPETTAAPPWLIRDPPLAVMADADNLAGRRSAGEKRPGILTSDELARQTHVEVVTPMDVSTIDDLEGSIDGTGAMTPFLIRVGNSKMDAGRGRRIRTPTFRSGERFGYPGGPTRSIWPSHVGCVAAHSCPLLEFRVLICRRPVC